MSSFLAETDINLVDPLDLPSPPAPKGNSTCPTLGYGDENDDTSNISVMGGLASPKVKGSKRGRKGSRRRQSIAMPSEIIAAEEKEGSQKPSVTFKPIMDDTNTAGAASGNSYTAPYDNLTDSIREFASLSSPFSARGYEIANFVLNQSGYKLLSSRQMKMIEMRMTEMKGQEGSMELHNSVEFQGSLDSEIASAPPPTMEEKQGVLMGLSECFRLMESSKREESEKVALATGVIVGGRDPRTGGYVYRDVVDNTVVEGEDYGRRYEIMLLERRKEREEGEHGGKYDFEIVQITEELEMENDHSEVESGDKIEVKSDTGLEVQSYSIPKEETLEDTETTKNDAMQNDATQMQGESKSYISLPDSSESMDLVSDSDNDEENLIGDGDGDDENLIGDNGESHPVISDRDDDRNDYFENYDCENDNCENDNCENDCQKENHCQNNKKHDYNPDGYAFNERRCPLAEVDEGRFSVPSPPPTLQVPQKQVSTISIHSAHGRRYSSPLSNQQPIPTEEFNLPPPKDDMEEGMKGMTQEEWRAQAEAELFETIEDALGQYIKKIRGWKGNHNKDQKKICNEKGDKTEEEEDVHSSSSDLIPLQIRKKLMLM